MTELFDPKLKPGVLERVHPALESRAGLAILVSLHILISCISLVEVSHYQSYMRYDGARLFHATAVVAAFSSLSVLFVLRRFSFGYFVGFYLYTMVMGFLWLNSFSEYQYNHGWAGFSAAASAVLFLLPALLIAKPIRPAAAVSVEGFERLLTLGVIFAVATIAIASTYHFRLTSLDHIYDFRDEIRFPTIIAYLIGIVSNALLPFIFASYLALNARWKALAVLLLFPLFYPITLSKIAFFAPAWIVIFLFLQRIFGARPAVVLSIAAPILIGVIIILAAPHRNESYAYFNLVNIRMIATPSSAMDIYNDFFASHPLSHFCQISFLKPFVGCPYADQIAVLMERTYHFGNLNASLFATEGIASVGLALAPLTALVCGLVVAIGNCASDGLPPWFILVSSALFPQILLNVPLTTGLLTYGAAFLFLFWYVTPRSIFRG
jgi:hypothetical protein